MRVLKPTSLRKCYGLFAAASACLALAGLPVMPALASPDLAAKQAEAERIGSEIANINLAAEQAVERFNQANVELETTRQQLAANQRSLAEASQSLVEAQQHLDKRLESIYRQDSLCFLDVALNTNTFSEFISRFDLLGKIGRQDKSDIDTVLRYKNKVESAQAELDQTRLRQEELLETLTSEKSQVEAQLDARQKLLAGVQGEVAELLAQQQQAVAAGSTPAEGSGPMPAPQPPADTVPAPAPAPEPAPAPVPEPEPEPAPSPAPPPSSGGAVAIAMQYLGVPYVWGGASPSGFDCSGLVLYVYAQRGIYLPHSAAAQYYSGTPISYGELAPGDLVFFGSPISHVGIYISGGRMIHAPFEGQVVSIANVGGGGGTYAGACRL